jgi:hypothetical protein
MDFHLALKKRSTILGGLLVMQMVIGKKTNERKKTEEI